MTIRIEREDITLTLSDRDAAKYGINEISFPSNASAVFSRYGGIRWSIVSPRDNPILQQKEYWFISPVTDTVNEISISIEAFRWVDVVLEVIDVDGDPNIVV